MARKAARKSIQRSWYKMDLHLHTPGSSDYQEPDVTYLDILKQAEIRGLDIIAFTDHNTVKGYANMWAEIHQLIFLQERGRADPEEIRRLQEYRRLLEKIVVLPGFEFTATFGFHILGIFPPTTPIRQLEHILMTLNVPLEALDEGTSNVGASADVLTAYRAIHENGGLAIAAHVNSTHGVAMKGLDFGGQTRIAYTQDPFLHALEVTDLEKRGRYTTARFFDGTKPGYSRRMRCIQGSDAHRLAAQNPKAKDLGIGDRVTEISLPECTFAAILEVFQANDFTLTRPYHAAHDPYDYVQAAREEGESIVQVFHPAVTQKGLGMARLIEDVCAFANTNGGTIWIGVSADPSEPPQGILKTTPAIESLYAEVDAKITPKLEIEVDTQSTQKKAVIRIQVPKGDDPPYVIDDYKIFIRDEAETSLAVRDEIVRIVRGNPKLLTAPLPPAASELHHTESEDLDTPLAAGEHELERHEELEESGEKSALAPKPDGSPLTGVEIIGTEKRRGMYYHMMRDLRNNNIIHNVTRTSARRLWHYAIIQAETKKFEESQIQWHDNVGLVRRYKRAGVIRYDLCHRVVDGNNKKTIRLYYGVTEDGMVDHWAQFINDEDIPEETDYH
jgi:PHP family Zn ribbon phosphoesterase